MNDPVPQLISQELIIENSVQSIYRNTYEKPDGEHFRMISRDGPPVVCILPFLTPDTLLLINQYRIIWALWSLEIPCGHAHPHESLETAARRELEEETGYHAKKLIPAFPYRIMASSPQLYHLYYAYDLQETQQRPDDTEQIYVKPTRLAALSQLLDQHQIIHAPSILAIQHLLITQNGP